jgi:type IV secretory pathway VirJ component
MRWLYVLILVVLAHVSVAAETLSHGRFRDLAIYRPTDEVTRVVLFMSGNEGWNATTSNMAQRLAADGALVAGIDIPSLFKDLSSDDATCIYPDGDLENLSHFLQAYYRLPTYRAPILVGRSSAGPFVYAMLAQAPAGTFAGGVSLGFCPYLSLAKPLCAGEGVSFTRRKDRAGVDLQPNKSLAQPWIVLHGELDRTCDPAVTTNFVAGIAGAQVVPVANASLAGEGDAWMASLDSAVDRVALASEVPSVVPQEVSDLPIVEVAAATAGGDTFAILLSGDGGWAGIDKALAHSLASHGIPVVGLDSLRYFWKPRTPQSTASDIERLVQHYLSAWKKTSVILIGYSQGADVLPFIVKRVSAQARARTRLVVLLGLEPTAQFEFHLSTWLGGADGGLPVKPELDGISSPPVMCIFGDGEKDSLCPELSKSRVRIVRVDGGHHFGGDYERLSRLILKELPPSAVR